MKTPKSKAPLFINSIYELHKLLSLPKPLHPLISLIDYEKVKPNVSTLTNSLILNFYKISFRKDIKGEIKYGQGHYDFDEGGMFFISPNQLIGHDNTEQDYIGYSLYVHPDFLRSYPLGAKIKTYGFFSYSVNEALFLSDKEKRFILSAFKNIKEELNNAIDNFSQDIMISQIEVLLNYSKRFYKRQFITRKVVNNNLLIRMEKLLNDYFDNKESLRQGLPTVEYLAEQLHFSPRYLSDLLRSLTGQNTQQHIHEKLIETAKEYLAAGNLSISEIAYQLGFEHSQSFSKLFKSKTNLSPLEFRRLFN